MNQVSNKQELCKYVSMSVLKRKFKQYMIDEGYEGFKSSVFPKYLIVSLVMVLEELLTDCLEFVKKDDVTGLYTINQSMLLTVLNKNTKYDAFLKYIKKFDSTIKYQDAVLFNYRLVVDNLETKFGDKLMIDSDVKNFVSYLLIGLQYELIKLSLMMVQYSNRLTLTDKSLLCSLNFLFKEMYPKIKLKLDSMKDTKETDEVDDEEQGEEQVEEQVEEKGEEQDEVEKQEKEQVKVEETEKTQETEHKTKKTKKTKKKVAIDEVEDELDELDKLNADK